MGPQLTVGTAAADAAALQKSCGHLCPQLEALKLHNTVAGGVELRCSLAAEAF